MTHPTLDRMHDARCPTFARTPTAHGARALAVVRVGRRRAVRAASVCLATLLAPVMIGCQGWDDWQQDLAPEVDERAVRAQALAIIRQGIAYQQNPVVRCQAIETLSETAPAGAEGWFIEALGDDNPGVRFAACVALGRMRHQPAKLMIERRLGDENHSVRAAALFALHRMGDTRRSGDLAELLLYHKAKEVRGNTAMLFGLLGEPKAVKLLERAARDSAYMVRWQALESRLILGDEAALPRVAAEINSGREDIRVLAMLAVGRYGERRSAEVLRYRLNREEDHLESRLAAARALGWLGFSDGIDLALTSLSFDSPSDNPKAGDPLNQIMRVRSMAALALGAIGDRKVLPHLKTTMTESEDPRVQVAAAHAILEILNQRKNRQPDRGLEVQ